MLCLKQPLRGRIKVESLWISDTKGENSVIRTVIAHKGIVGGDCSFISKANDFPGEKPGILGIIAYRAVTRCDIEIALAVECQGSAKIGSGFTKGRRYKYLLYPRELARLNRARLTLVARISGLLASSTAWLK